MQKLNAPVPSTITQLSPREQAAIMRGVEDDLWRLILAYRRGRRALDAGDREKADRIATIERALFMECANAVAFWRSMPDTWDGDALFLAEDADVDATRGIGASLERLIRDLSGEPSRRGKRTMSEAHVTYSVAMAQSGEHHPPDDAPWERRYAELVTALAARRTSKESQRRASAALKAREKAAARR